jgi:ABC-2 type transport system ATP-binding protein
MSAPSTLSSPPDTMIALDGMTRRYGEVVAAEGVTFEVRRGEMFGLIGPDGAGKTTTLRVVLGLLAPDAGRVRTCGLEPVKQGDLLSRKIGYLSQRFSLYGDLTVDENISFFASIHGVKGWKARRDELLDLLRMTQFRGRLADRLSGGMKQKLALACTLIHTPELLVLDEPTTGVDPVSRRDFWKILSRLQRDGLTLLVTTPYLDEAERCQRIALMDRGRLLTVDAPAHLKQQAGDAIVEILARPKREATERLRERPEVSDVQSFGERLHATLHGVGPAEADAAASRLAADLTAHGIEVESARAVPPTLEDIFIARIEAAGLDAAAPVEVTA